MEDNEKLKEVQANRVVVFVFFFLFFFLFFYNYFYEDFDVTFNW